VQSSTASTRLSGASTLNVSLRKLVFMDFTKEKLKVKFRIDISKLLQRLGSIPNQLSIADLCLKMDLKLRLFKDLTGTTNVRLAKTRWKWKKMFTTSPSFPKNGAIQSLTCKLLRIVLWKAGQSFLKAKSIMIIIKPKAAQLVNITAIMVIEGSRVLTRSVHTTR